MTADENAAPSAAAAAAASAAATKGPTGPASTEDPRARLDFSLLHGKLYDRDREKARLLDSYHRLLQKNPQRELVIISGHSGTGKSALAQQTLRPPAVGLMLAGKFDQLRTPKPFAAFAQAFTQYVGFVVQQGPSAMEKARHAIEEAVGSECQLLTDMIPALEQLLGKRSGGAPVPQGREAQERFKYVFRLFVKSICSTLQEPMVLLLDDLQWADTSSLRLLHALVTDTENQESLLIVGTCRHNEVSVRDEFAGTLRDLEDGGIIINNIAVSNLSQKAVNDMISDLLQIPATASLPLTEVVWNETKGNIFFVIYFLRYLEEKGFLCVDPVTSQWTWKESSISGLDPAGDVVSLLERIIGQLADGVQEELKTAACLGAEFTEGLLRKALPDSAVPVDVFLAKTAERGLVVFDSQSDCFKFVHDRVQQAAYSLIVEQERSSFHLALGRTLWNTIPAEQLHDHIFILVSQLSRGIDLVESQNEKYRIAALSLRAGEQAVLSSAFTTAATYFQLGIDVLGERCWFEEYDISLALYDALAEVAYCNGDFEQVDLCVDEILKNATSFRDKLRASSTQVYALGARDRLDESIDVAFGVLRLLGEPFPNKVGSTTVAVELTRTRWQLRGKTDGALLRLPTMTDPDKNAAMKILNLVFLHTYQARPEFAPLVLLRMVRLSMHYGLSPISCVSFAMYGMLLCAALGDMEEGYRFGQLALKMHDRLGATEYIPRLYAGVYGCIHHWKHPIRKGLKGIKHASHVGFLTGDIEYGALEANVYCINSLDAGHFLEELEKDMRRSCTVMASYNQNTELWLGRIILQAVLTLRGQHTGNPLVLTGEVLDEDEAIQEMESKNNVTFLGFLYLMKLWIAIILGEFDQAAKVAIKCRNIDKVAVCAFDACVQTFFDGMAALALAQQRNRKGKNLIVAKKCLKRMSHWAKHCPSNCLHKRYLMEAEFAALHRKHYVAVEKFVSGIALSKEEGFLHVQALGHERFGRYLLERGDKSYAMAQLRKALEVYTSWGAKVKVDLLEQELLTLQKD